MSPLRASLLIALFQGLLYITTCSREARQEILPGALRRPSVNLAGYKDLTWGQTRQEVEGVWHLRRVDAEPLVEDRLMRWGSPSGGAAACGLFCGTSFQDALWIWYGVPSEVQGEGKNRSVRPVRTLVPTGRWEVYRVERYDEYVTFADGALVAYWFPLSLKDWDKARAILQEKYGPPWADLSPLRIKSKTPDFEEEIVFEFRGTAWFGPQTNITSLSERYMKEGTAFTLGYVLYLDSAFDLRTQVAVQEQVREMEKAKKAPSRDEEFVKSVVE